MFSITVTIIVITCLVSFAAFNNQKVLEDLLFWPSEIKRRKQYYRFFSYGFIHLDFFHIAFNLFTLYSFGERLERYTFAQNQVFGTSAKIFYLILYVTAIIISVIPDYLKNKNNFSYRALGASGAVSAVLFACIILDPKLSLYLLFIPIPIPGYVFGIIYLAYSAYMAKQGNTNIGHATQFSGAIYGLLFTIIATKLYSDYNAVQTFLRILFNHPV
jgi:membrane associated rhomboid family serine protease